MSNRDYFFSAKKEKENKKMSGYCEYSKSNNAILAEQEGLKTASKLAKYLSKKFKKYRNCSAKDIKKILRPEEWHHTSSWYNETNYYSIIDLGELITRIYLQEQIQKRTNSKPVKYENYIVEWLEWYGNRNRPKKIRRKEYNCTIEFNGKSTYKIIFSDGKSIIKRKETRGLNIYKNKNGRKHYI